MHGYLHGVWDVFLDWVRLRYRYFDGNVDLLLHWVRLWHQNFDRHWSVDWHVNWHVNLFLHRVWLWNMYRHP